MSANTGDTLLVKRIIVEARRLFGEIWTIEFNKIGFYTVYEMTGKKGYPIRSGEEIPVSELASWWDAYQAGALKMTE